MADRCHNGIVIDFDSIDCTLPLGHEGMHLCIAEGGEFEWRFRERPWSSDLIRSVNDEVSGQDERPGADIR